jgi:hypothetical protein
MLTPTARASDVVSLAYAFPNDTGVIIKTVQRANNAYNGGKTTAKIIL